MSGHYNIRVRVCKHSLYFMPHHDIDRYKWFAMRPQVYTLDQLELPIAHVVPNEYGHSSDMFTDAECMAASECDCNPDYQMQGDVLIVSHNVLKPTPPDGPQKGAFVFDLDDFL